MLFLYYDNTESDSGIKINLVLKFRLGRSWMLDISVNVTYDDYNLKRNVMSKCLVIIQEKYQLISKHR